MGLWKNRNTKLWEDTARSPLDLLFGCMTWLEEFQKSRASEKMPRQPNLYAWQSPAADTLKLNIDGAYVPHLTKGGIGGILRNSRGNVVAAFQRLVHFVSSAFHVELLATQAGLELIRRHNYRSVVIETDCQIAVQDICSASPVLTQYGTLIVDIQTTFKNLQLVRLCFGPRTCNRVAHRLAGIAFESNSC
ncbi:uncharacterized protein LOC112181303 [Rosa chinensis]|uniref:uncharacterized protein LOC112181303 n=1 Tax=Rosa chinensis TaxID=74649 RepID=UPI000D08D779|nr:uncharacterized protein LOC112181303 [Rosa chinensis]